jgi:predicted RNA-binding Zn-ribbon protein involved in translation (DUF1610 family)
MSTQLPPPLPGSDDSIPPPLDGAVPPPPPGGTVPPPPPTSTTSSDPAPAPATPPEGGEPARDHSLRHGTQSSRTYPCTACGGELEFHIGQQKLTCSHCGNVQELLEAQDGPIGETDLRGALASLRANADEHRQLIEGEKEIVCQNCGGHTTFTGSLTSTRCPYCATPIQRDDIHDAPARLPVDGVLPFTVDEKQAKQALEKWVSSRWFAPKEFKTYNRTGSFTSVYAAYFAYDAEASTRYRGARGDDYTVTVGSGKDQRTETRTRWSNVSGTVHDSFDDLTVLANEGFNRNHVTALEPWPTKDAKPFSPEYVAGHLCRTYDHDVEECFVEGKQRMDSEIESTIRRDIGGDHQRIKTKDTTFSRLTFTHLLLPIWLLTVIYQGQPFQVVINGVTGETHGERPYSRVKIAAAVALVVVLIVIGVLLFGSAEGA